MAYVELAELLYVNSADTLKYLCEKAVVICEKALLGNPTISEKKSLQFSLASAYNNIAFIYQGHGEIEKSLELNNKSLELFEEIEYVFGIANSLNNIGYIYDNQGDIPKALSAYHKSLKLLEKIDDKRGVAYSLTNLASLYNSQGDKARALSCFLKSIKLHKEVGDKAGEASATVNVGAFYSANGDLVEALRYCNRSLELYEELGHLSGIASSLYSIGLVYKAQGDLPTSLEYQLRSLEINKQLDFKIGWASSLLTISELQLQMGLINESLENGVKSLAIGKEYGYPNVIKNASKLLSNIYEKQGKGSLALEMYRLSIEMSDSMNNESTQKATIKQQAKYEYEKQKVLDDAAHDKLLAIEQEEKEKQQILTVATAGGLGLVVLFLFFVFNRLRVTKKQKQVIEKQKQEVELQKVAVEKTHAELEERNKEITDSIQYAKRIQSAILPPPKVVKEYLKESFILYKPKDIVAGDFYWLEQVVPADTNGLDAQKVLFAAADCTGHGVPGAMVSVVCNNALNRSVREHGLTDPGQILDKTREIVIAEFAKSDEEVKDGMDIALCCLEGTTLKYAGAHNPLWIIRKGELLETKANKQPIGQFDNPEPYITHAIELQKGDSVYIFSDGYADQFGGEKGKKLKTANFKKLLLSIQDKSMEVQHQLINKSFEDWRGNLEQLDDVCVIGVRI